RARPPLRRRDPARGRTARRGHRCRRARLGPDHDDDRRREPGRPRHRRHLAGGDDGRRRVHDDHRPGAGPGDPRAHGGPGRGDRAGRAQRHRRPVEHHGDHRPRRRRRRAPRRPRPPRTHGAPRRRPAPSAPPRHPGDRSMSRRTPFVTTLVTLPVLLGGCGLGQSVAGIHDAPTESSDGAAITEGAGRDVAARVLDRAAERREEGAKATAEARAELFSGPALREADAAARTDDDGDAAEEHEDLTVLSISRGSDWPRAVLATSRDGDVQRLHVLVSEDADRAYRLFADVPMAAGSSVPALAPAAEGAPVTVSDAPDEAVTSAADAWAKGVAYPTPSTAPSGVSFEDAFSSALAKNAKAEDEDLDDLADYRQRQARVDADSVTFDLAGGGQ